MSWTNSCNIDLLACRAMHGRGFTGCLARCFRNSDSDRLENDHKSVRGSSKDPREEAECLSLTKYYPSFFKSNAEAVNMALNIFLAQTS